jgi:hypothetical protein
MKYAGSQGSPSVLGRLIARGSIAVNLVFVGSVVVVVVYTLRRWVDRPVYPMSFVVSVGVARMRVA